MWSNFVGAIWFGFGMFRSYRRVELHVDSKVIVNTLIVRAGGNVSGARLVKKIIQWLNHLD